MYTIHSIYYVCFVVFFIFVSNVNIGHVSWHNTMSMFFHRGVITLLCIIVCLFLAKNGLRYKKIRLLCEKINISFTQKTVLQLAWCLFTAELFFVMEFFFTSQKWYKYHFTSFYCAMMWTLVHIHYGSLLWSRKIYPHAKIILLSWLWLMVCLGTLCIPRFSVWYGYCALFFGLLYIPAYVSTIIKGVILALCLKGLDVYFPIPEIPFEKSCFFMMIISCLLFCARNTVSFFTGTSMVMFLMLVVFFDDHYDIMDSALYDNVIAIIVAFFLTKNRIVHQKNNSFLLCVLSLNFPFHDALMMIFMYGIAVFLSYELLRSIPKHCAFFLYMQVCLMYSIVLCIEYGLWISLCTFMLFYCKYTYCETKNFIKNLYLIGVKN